ncbi:MAG: prepilin-type N-terminal cleavage/methylation domain-containing protein [Pseudomonadota bacterium]|nr:prepilin-type N-terminal cleavage/methylation domain-containing protein [Pseudomonadota bacterium]
MDRAPASSQHGFSLIEVLAVLIISSTLLVSLNTLVMMSQRSYLEFSAESADRSKEFFFEHQFAALISALEYRPHPDVEGPCQLTGNSDGFSGCFYDVFDDARSAKAFSISIQTVDGGSTVKLTYGESEFDWAVSAQAISVGYMNANGTVVAEWPPQQTQQVARNDDPVVPRGVVLNFGKENEPGWERRLFATET